jgi:NAD(P)-dependent dehydrogenase (short-subunit alcohol dehydrogenase family)
MSAARDSGRVALVTGAADPDGIGAACAHALAAAGYAVGLLDRRSCELVVDQLVAGGARARAVVVDLADEAATLAAVAQLHEALGEVVILVNCAADLTRAPLGELDAVTLRRVLDVNVVAAAVLARAVAPGMARRGTGRIVNIASDTFDRPPAPGMTAYIASKGALIGLTRALALELGPAGITVNAISPGLTRTGGAQAGQPPAMFDAVRASQAIDRTLTSADYAGVLTFLVSEAAAVLTGQTLRADAGLVMA